MDTEQIITWISQNILKVLLIVTVFIQITPIKWNPITSFVKWFGKIITADLSKQVTTCETERLKQANEIKQEIGQKVEEFTKAIQNIQRDVDTNEKDRIRWEVLDFARSCRNNTSHTYDEFKHILKLNDKYQQLLEKTKDKNGVFDSEIKYINNLFDAYKQQNNIKEE